MGVSYQRDDTARRIIVTIDGIPDPAQVLAVIERQRAEQTWDYALLYDIRQMKVRYDTQQLRNFFGRAASGGAGRGPVACVATDPKLYDMACAYQAISRKLFPFEVFRDIDEAVLWLDKQRKLAR